jgi:hypothetical protein
MANRLGTFVVRTFLVGAIVLPPAERANAALLTGTFGPGDSFLGESYLIGNSLFQQEIAAGFAPEVTATLDTIRVAAFFDSGLNDFTVYIAPNIAGEPGSPLESFTNLSFGVVPGILTLNSISHPLLTAGTRYWVVMTAPQLANSQGEWNLNDQGFGGVLARNFFGAFAWTLDPGPTPAFDVSGTVVPEPSTFVLASAALAVFGACVRRKPAASSQLFPHRRAKRKSFHPAIL